jgi:hypothetical protein
MFCGQGLWAAFGRLRQEGSEFEASFGYVGRPCRKTKQNNKQTKQKTSGLLAKIRYILYLVTNAKRNVYFYLTALLAFYRYPTSSYWMNKLLYLQTKKIYTLMLEIFLV